MSVVSKYKYGVTTYDIGPPLLENNLKKPPPVPTRCTKLKSQQSFPKRDSLS